MTNIILCLRITLCACSRLIRFLYHSQRKSGLPQNKLRSYFSGSYKYQYQLHGRNKKISKSFNAYQKDIILSAHKKLYEVYVFQSLSFLSYRLSDLDVSLFPYLHFVYVSVSYFFLVSPDTPRASTGLCIS
jgi:hypothetical protein